MSFWKIILPLQKEILDFVDFVRIEVDKKY